MLICVISHNLGYRRLQIHPVMVMDSMNLIIWSNEVYDIPDVNIFANINIVLHTYLFHVKSNSINR